MKKRGRVIILNGVSSSGKSTLARALQAQASFPVYRLDIDDFILMAPDKFNDYENRDFSVQYNFASKFFHVVKLYSDMGFDLVVPYMFLKGSDVLKNFKELLRGYPITLVNVECPVSELRRREELRGNRVAGSAENQLPLLETELVFDLTVNSFKNSSEECAEIILAYLKK